MNNELVTLAVHTNEKAQILKNVLERENIPVQIESIDHKTPDKVSTGVRVRIFQSDLPKALSIVERYNLFDYSDERTLQMDDGRKRILIPVDFSDYSLNACQVAFTIAGFLDAKIKILHIFHSPYFPSALPMAKAFDYGDDGKKKYKDILDKVNARMQQLCKTIDQKVKDGVFPCVNYSYSIREGMPEEDIVAYAQRYKPEMIIMGTKGKDMNDTEVLGSVTAEVIEMSEYPVLAVPKDSSFKDSASVRHIAFLTNFAQRDLISFDQLVSYIKPGPDVKITLLHFNIINKKQEKWNEDDIKKIRDYFAQQYPTLNIGYKLISASDMFTVVAKYFDDEKVDIAVLNTRKRNLFIRMFAPSVSRKILAQSNTTLLVLRG